MTECSFFGARGQSILSRTWAATPSTARTPSRTAGWRRTTSSPSTRSSRSQPRRANPPRLPAQRPSCLARDGRFSLEEAEGLKKIRPSSDEEGQRQAEPKAERDAGWCDRCAGARSDLPPPAPPVQEGGLTPPCLRSARAKGHPQPGMDTHSDGRLPTVRAQPACYTAARLLLAR